MSLLSVQSCPIYIVTPVDDSYRDKNDPKNWTNTEHLRYCTLRKFLRLEFVEMFESQGTLFFTLKTQVVEEKEYMIVFEKCVHLLKRNSFQTDKRFELDGIIFHRPDSLSQKVEEILFEEYRQYSDLRHILPQELFSLLIGVVTGEVRGHSVADTLSRVVRFLYFNKSSSIIGNIFPTYFGLLNLWKDSGKIKKGHIYMAKYRLKKEGIDGEEEKKERKGPVLVLDEKILPLTALAINESDKTFRYTEIHSFHCFLKKDKKIIECHDVPLPLALVSGLTSEDEEEREESKRIEKMFKELRGWKKRKEERIRKRLKKLEEEYLKPESLPIVEAPK